MLELAHAPRTRHRDFSGALEPSEFPGTPVLNERKARRRILIVAEPTVDGVFVFTAQVIAFLQRHNITVDYAYSSARTCSQLTPLLDQVIEHGGHVLDLRVDNRPSWRDVPALVRLLRFIRARRPAVVHAMSSKAGVLARALAGLGCAPAILYQPHAYFGLSGERRAWVRFFVAIEAVLGPLGRVIVVSPSEAQYAHSRLGIRRSQLRLVSQPIDTSHFQPPTPGERARARQALSVEPHEVLLGAVGRISFQKDPWTLHEAFALLAKDRPHWRLLHVGRGPLQDEIHALTKTLGTERQIIWSDYLPDPRHLYAAMDLLVHPSRYEGMSLVCLEALSCGLPLVATTCPGNVDLQRFPWSHAWFAPCANAGAVAAAIIQWERDRRAGRPSNHAALIRQHFSPERCFRALLAEYDASTGPAPAVL